MSCKLLFYQTLMSHKPIFVGAYFVYDKIIFVFRVQVNKKILCFHNNSSYKKYFISYVFMTVQKLPNLFVLKHIIF